jgi:hypothetical protein
VVRARVRAHLGLERLVEERLRPLPVPLARGAKHQQIVRQQVRLPATLVDERVQELRGQLQPLRAHAGADGDVVHDLAGLRGHAREALRRGGGLLRVRGGGGRLQLTEERAKKGRVHLGGRWPAGEAAPLLEEEEEGLVVVLGVEWGT